MSTLVNEATRTRLDWIAEQLQKLYDNGWIRYEGETVFRGAQAELNDIRNTAEEPVTVQAPPIYNVMTEEQVSAVASDIKNTVVEQSEASDVAVMSAITQSQGEVIAAVNAAAAPAPAA